MNRVIQKYYNEKTGEYDLDFDPTAEISNDPDNPVNQIRPVLVSKAVPVTDPCKAVPVNDPVNHPSHYTSGKIEVIDFIEDQKLDFHLANALKYICRAGKKDPKKTKEDLEKAVWYLNRYITHCIGDDAS